MKKYIYILIALFGMIRSEILLAQGPVARWIADTLLTRDNAINGLLRAKKYPYYDFNLDENGDGKNGNVEILGYYALLLNMPSDNVVNVALKIQELRVVLWTSGELTLATVDANGRFSGFIRRKPKIGGELIFIDPDNQNLVISALSCLNWTDGTSFWHSDGSVNSDPEESISEPVVIIPPGKNSQTQTIKPQCTNCGASDHWNAFCPHHTTKNRVDTVFLVKEVTAQSTCSSGCGDKNTTTTSSTEIPSNLVLVEKCMFCESIKHTAEAHITKKAKGEWWQEHKDAVLVGTVVGGGWILDKYVFKGKKLKDLGYQGGSKSNGGSAVTKGGREGSSAYEGLVADLLPAPKGGR